MSTSNGKVENTIPVLSVADLAGSIRFYTDVLGFKLDWGGEPDSTAGSVSRDGHCIMLTQNPAGNPSVVWVGLTDDSLFEKYMSKGVQVVQPPVNKPWAYEMKIADLDGNVLWLGTEPKAE